MPRNVNRGILMAYKWFLKDETKLMPNLLNNLDLMIFSNYM